MNQSTSFLPGQHLQGTHILVVEDDPNIRMLLGEIFSEECSCIVRLVPTGKKALEIPPEARPDVIILDYLLEAGMTGIEVYDQLHLRAGWQDIPTILVSATPPWTDIRARGLQGIQKPFEMEALVTTVEKALQHALPAAC